MSWFGDDDKVRKGEWPVWDYQFKYFPLAWLEEVRVAVIGNQQHNAGQPLHWAREKSKDQLNTAFRHLCDYAEAKARGVTVPRDSKGNAVLAQSIWRLKAQLQLDLEQEAKEKAVPKVGIRDTSQSVPAGIVVERCGCGEREFTYSADSLPPQVVSADKKTMHRAGAPCYQLEAGPSVL